MIRADSPEQAYLAEHEAKRIIADAAAAREAAVNHPAHYGGDNNLYEAIKVIEAWGLGFHAGNALKYLCRAGHKDGNTALQDLMKARWYLDRLISMLEEQHNSSGLTSARPERSEDGRGSEQ